MFPQIRRTAAIVVAARLALVHGVVISFYGQNLLLLLLVVVLLLLWLGLLVVSATTLRGLIGSIARILQGAGAAAVVLGRRWPRSGIQASGLGP